MAAEKTSVPAESNSTTPEGLPGLQGLASRAASGYRSVGSMVYDVLREAILTGMFTPGEKLRQETLAEAIGVSRVPVRSALIQLEADGLIEMQDRKGAVVRSLSPEQVAEIYELRILLEQHALVKSMATMDSERIARLELLADTSDTEHEGADFVRAREEFYAVLYDSQNNPVLWEMIEDLRLKVGRYMLGWRIADEHDHSHRELVDIVITGNVDAALDALRHHLGHVRDGVLTMIDRERAHRVRS